MSDEDIDLTIMPSWQDVAERWQTAWREEAQSKEVAEARLRLLEARFEALRKIWLEGPVGVNSFYINGFPDRLAQLADLFDADIAENTRALLDPQ